MGMEAVLEGVAHEHLELRKTLGSGRPDVVLLKHLYHGRPGHPGVHRSGVQRDDETGHDKGHEPWP